MQIRKRYSGSRFCSVLICAIVLCSMLCFAAYAGELDPTDLINTDLESLLEYAKEQGIDSNELSDLDIIENICKVSDPASIDGGMTAQTHTIYQFENGGVLKGAVRSTPDSANAGITVPENAVVILEIPHGKTLEVYGGYNAQQKRSMPAIRVPFGSTLIIQGGGTLIAHAANASVNNSAAAPAIGGAAGTAKVKPEDCGDVYIIADTTVRTDLPVNLPGLSNDMGVCMGIDAGGIYNKGEALPFHGNVFVESESLIPGDTRPAAFHSGRYTLLRDVKEIRHDEQGKPYALPRYFMEDTADNGMSHLGQIDSRKVLALSMRGMTGYYNRFCAGGRELYVSLGPAFYGHTPTHIFSDNMYSVSENGMQQCYKVCVDNCTGYYFEVMNAIERVTDGCYIGNYKDYGRDSMVNDDIYASIGATRKLLKNKLIDFAPSKTSGELLYKIIDDWMYDGHWCDPFKHNGNTKPYCYEHEYDGAQNELTTYGYSYFTVLNCDATQALTTSYDTMRCEHDKQGSCSSTVSFYYIKGGYTDSRGQFVQLDVTVGIGYDPKSWMASIPDEAYVNQINMPGTHDTGCFDIKCELIGRMIATTQTKNLREQMDAGIRVFDIRLKSEERLNESDPEKEFWVNHGGLACQNPGKGGGVMYLSNVLNEAGKFISSNPTETMMIFLNSEGDENKYYQPNLESLRKKFDLKIDSKGNWTSGAGCQGVPVIYVRSDGDGAESHIVPTLGQARGKIILFHAKSMTKYEDHYNNVWPDEKIGYLKKAFSECEDHIPQEYAKPGYFKKEGELEVPDHMGDPNIRVIFSSQYYYAPFPNPLSQCTEINYWMANHHFIRGKRYGWIMMNDPKAEQIRNIILSNNTNRMPHIEHEHEWTYSVGPENTITAVCKRPFCPLKDGIAQVVLLTPDVVYNGEPYNYAAYQQSKVWERYVCKLPYPEYRKLNGDGSWTEPTEQAPRDPGRYRASATFRSVDNKTYVIHSDFNITGPVQFSVEGYEGVYDGQPHTVTATAILPESGVSYSFKYGNSVTATPPTFTDAGVYSVEVTASAYGYAVSQPQTAVVKIRKAHHANESYSAELYNCKGAKVTVVPANVPGLSRYNYDDWKCPPGIGWYEDAYKAIVFNVSDVQPKESGFTVKRKISSSNFEDYIQSYAIKLIEHYHDWKYRSDGTVLIAECKTPYCTVSGGVVSVELIAPNAVYNGREYAQTAVNGLDAWNSAGASGLVLSYEGLTQAPVLPGKYTVVITPVGNRDVHAKKAFEIARADYPGEREIGSELYNEEGFTTVVELPVLPTGGKYLIDRIKLPDNLTIRETGPSQLAVCVKKKLASDDSIQVTIPVCSMECYNDFDMILTLYPVQHRHEWKYYKLEGDDAVLVAICNAERCTIPLQQGYHAVGVRVSAPDKTYDGRPYDLSDVGLENEAQWRAYGAGEIEVCFVDADAPVYPGTYAVSASPAGDPFVIAHASFTITNSQWRGDTEFNGELYNVEGYTSELYLPPLPVGGSYDLANMSIPPEGVHARINEDGQLLLTVNRQLEGIDSFTMTIPVSDSRDFKSYAIIMHVTVVDHEHKWQYSADGSRLIAECINPMLCTIPTMVDGKHAIATMLRADDMLYNRRDYPKSNITLSGLEEWYSYAGIAHITVGFEGGKTPSDVGQYTALAITGSGDNIVAAKANFHILPGAILDITDASANVLHARIQDSPAISALSPILEAEDYKTGAEIELVATELFDISDAEKQLVRSHMYPGEKIAMVADLSMYKTVLGNRTKMSVLPNGAVYISGEIPGSIRSRIAEIEVIGIHNGKAARLGAAYNKHDGIVSFNTDRFSTYVFVYTRRKVPDTGDHDHPVLWGINALMALIGILFLNTRRHRG